MSQCSLVHEIIQHVEYSELMARVTKIAEHDTAHLRKQLTPAATIDAQLSSADSSSVRRALSRQNMVEIEYG